MIVRTRHDPQCLSFAQHPAIATIGSQGPATPDHLSRTKRLPLIGRDIAGYVAQYRDYFSPARPGPATDDARPGATGADRPRTGVAFAVHRTIKDALIAEDIYRHTIDIILRAQSTWRLSSAASPGAV